MKYNKFDGGLSNSKRKTIEGQFSDERTSTYLRTLTLLPQRQTG